MVSASHEGKSAVVDLPSAAEVEERVKEGEQLTGRELYDRFLKNRNRLRALYQESHSVSSDEAGNPQRVNFWMQWKDYRDGDDNPVGDLFSKTIIKFTGPYELRHSGYLFIHHDRNDDEQFMYSPVRGRTMRVSAKGQAIAGTDFSFEDFLVSVNDIGDADYKRHADATVDGVDCYVVEAFMKPEAKSTYTRSLSYLEKEHYVPLRTLYWDSVGVKSKELTAVHSTIKNFDGVWVASESTMKDLLEDTQTTLYVDLLEANPDLSDLDLELSALAAKP